MSVSLRLMAAMSLLVSPVLFPIIFFVVWAEEGRPELWKSIKTFYVSGWEMVVCG